MQYLDASACNGKCWWARTRCWPTAVSRLKQLNTSSSSVRFGPQVLVGAHALLANGGVIAPSGTALVAAAAKKHAVPFVVLVGLHKLSPMFPHDPAVTFNEFKSPGDVLEYDAIAETLAAGRPDDDSGCEATCALLRTFKPLRSAASNLNIRRRSCCLSLVVMLLRCRRGLLSALPGSATKALRAPPLQHQ